MRLREEGATVTVADIDVEAARTVSEALGSGDDAIAVQVDVSDEQAVKASIDEMVARFGGVDIVVNNAGLSISKALLETSVEDWDRQHDVMARGSFLVSKHAARVMIAQETGGDILYIVSKNAIVAGPSNLAYGSAKASQAHQVRLLAAELGSAASASTASTPTPSSRDPGSSREAGGRSGPGLRGGGARAWTLLCEPDAAQAGGAPRACGERGLLPAQRRADPHHRAHRPRRRRHRRGVPALSRPPTSWAKEER